MDANERNRENTDGTAKRKPSVLLVTFGCQMNEYDSELVRSILTDAGYIFTDDEFQADIVMLNTCSVRENAHRKVYGHIHEIRHRAQGTGHRAQGTGHRAQGTGHRAQGTGHRAEGPLIGILGCMATGLRNELLEDKALGMDFVVGPDSYKRLPEILKGVLENHGHGYDVTLSEFETYADVYPTRTAGVNAWVAVMRGCNNFCSFCIVPYTRGRERSRSVKSVVEEVTRLVDEGFPQVTLLGQNVNSYQHDGDDFAALLEAVSRVAGIRRIRFTAPHPKDFPESLIRVLAEDPKVCKHVHLPLQAGNDRVLRAMNRGYTDRDYLALAARLRRACPHVALTTDIIVGFPTEADDEFEDTVRIMTEVRFDAAFIFKYSVRPDTAAAGKFRDDVPEKVKTERIVRLNKLQTDISLKKNETAVGEVQEILVEETGGRKGNAPYGRNDANKIVTFSHGQLAPGQFVHARIVRATPHRLEGEVVSRTEG